ncbi:uncharacterized protein HMPREF1541_02328 [Cyphellophora europaea CBS 101466]|uniref:Phosphoglycerate mutase n=1 Tax=Cyphellophora europaea (strain CBS 101466) TaxID=1220924 RepID=W2S3I5_CYPE1|nr:uncharacterized protein HMPREF1541_02328 [Cyphellophora europaea CBS 101466]ETN43170.1 hypothetical protein HMPREF1541_02328 [Cyphellophora europaea CBS 101466]
MSSTTTASASSTSSHHPELHLLFIRHGETQDNIERVLQGHRDTSLTAKGLAEAGVLARKLHAEHPHGVAAIYHSPLQRIVQTVQPFLDLISSTSSGAAAASGQAPSIYADADLRGQGLGQLEGASYDAIDMSSPRSADGRPGVEDFDVFVGRLKRVFGRIVGVEAPKTAASGKDRTVLIATHGVAITSLFKALEASPACDNFGPAVAERGPEAWEVRWTDSDDVARLVVKRPGELPLKDREGAEGEVGKGLDWDGFQGKPFLIDMWGKKEKAL